VKIIEYLLAATAHGINGRIFSFNSSSALMALVGEMMGSVGVMSNWQQKRLSIDE
jgi:hypothetical protein